MAKETTMENGKNIVVESAHKALLVGLGAVAVAQDELTGLTSKFVKQGETVEKKSRETVSELVEARKQEVKDVTKRAEDALNQQMEAVLHRLNIPTRSEIEKLSKKISQLSKKVDELSKSA